MKLTYRTVAEKDIPVICSWTKNQDELFYFFPRAIYPLTPEQLNKAIAQRKNSTVPDVVVDEPIFPHPQLKGKKGIALFKVQGWSNAEGHVTVWAGADAATCYDACYFNAHKATYFSNQLLLWELK